MKKSTIILIFLYVYHLIKEIIQIFMDGYSSIMPAPLDVLLTLLIVSGWFYLLYKEYLWFYILNTILVIVGLLAILGLFLLGDRIQADVKSYLWNIPYNLVYAAYIIIMTKRIREQKRYYKK